MSTYTLSLSDANATLDTVGGKGLSLAKMVSAALPAPDGFHICGFVLSLQEEVARKMDDLMG